MWDAIKGTKYERHWRSFVHIRNTQAADVMKRRSTARRKTGAFSERHPGICRGRCSLLPAAPTFRTDARRRVRPRHQGRNLDRALGAERRCGGRCFDHRAGTGLHQLQETRELSESATNIGASVFLGSLIGAGGAKLVKHAEWKRSVTALDRDLNGYPAVATGEKRYVVTESGRRFVALEDGSDIFGNITPAIAREAGLESGPVRLPEGFQTPEGHGAGELHIEAKRGEELRAQGHKDAAEFVKSVTSGFDEIYRHDPDTVMLVRRNERGIWSRT